MKSMISLCLACLGLVLASECEPQTISFGELLNFDFIIDHAEGEIDLTLQEHSHAQIAITYNISSRFRADIEGNNTLVVTERVDADNGWTASPEKALLSSSFMMAGTSSGIEASAAIVFGALFLPSILGICDDNLHIEVAYPRGVNVTETTSASQSSLHFSAILCDKNQYVSSHVCVACPVGTENAADDDATAQDTVCDDVEECASSPCQNGGSCTDGDGTGVYACACGSGWTGSDCDATIPFVSTWRVEQDATVTLPLYSSGTYKFSISWGDGSPMESRTQHDVSHSYTDAGSYTVQIFGTLTGFSFKETPASKDHLTSISNWGSLRLGDTTGHFKGCSNLELFNSTDNLDVSDVADMSNMFYQASKFNGDLNAWNTAAVTTMSYMFRQASVFNGDLNAWNTAAVTTMNYMFYEASVFNGSLSAWNTTASGCTAPC